MIRPLVSVVVPVFNDSGHLPEAIASIRAQQYEPLEIIVVDDGSEQPVEATLREPGVTVLRQANAGPAAARNLGLRAARGEWIGFLDADDLWPKGKLDLQGGCLEEDPELDIVLGRIRYVRMAGADPIPIQCDPYDPSMSHIHLGSLLCRRRAFDRIGLFDPTLRFSEDHDWLLRAREAGLRMRILNAVTLLYRLHETNMTRQKDIHQLRLMEVLHKSLIRRRAHGGPAAELPRWTTHADQRTGANPLVTAIVPAFNGERFIAQAVRSILEQTYDPIEIVVVDDGSSDGTRQAVAEFPGARWIEQAHQGPGAARNRGVTEANGELLAFLDQDDLWKPEKIQKQVDYLNEHPETDYVLTASVYFLEKGMERPKWLKEEALHGELKGLEPSALMARRRAFDKVGLFTPSLISASDSDWFFRAKDAGLAMGWMSEVLLERRFHDANQSAVNANRELLEVARASIRRQRGPTGKST